VPPIVLETLLGDAAKHAHVGIYVYDDEGTYVAVNDHAAALLGTTRDELLRHDIGDFTRDGIDRRVLLRTERREGVRLLRRRDGTEVPAAFVVVPTQVSGLGFFVAIVWELEPDDPRAAAAT